ncbi:MAG: ABC transporter permease [Vicinamibacterales bacterium]
MNVWRIARQEWRDALRTRTLPMLAGVVTLLLGAAAVVGHDRAVTQSTQRAAAQAMVAAQFRAQPDRHPHRVAHYGFLVFRPEAPLAVVDRGLDAYAGSTVFLEAHRQNLATFADASQTTGIRRFGELTIALVLQLFVPLIVLCSAAVALTRDRTDGTLPLALCQGATPMALTLGKWLAVTGTTLILVLPGLLVAWLASGGLPGKWDADQTARLVLLIATHGVFIAVVAALGLALSAWSRQSRTALAAAVGLWLAVWIIGPRVVPILAAASAPAPSRAAFEAEVEREVRRVGDSHNPADPNFNALRVRTLADYGVSRVEDLPVNYNGIVMREGERLTTETYRRMLGQLHARWSTQIGWLQLAGLVSPYVAVRTASMTLAGTDLVRLRAFDEQAEDYRYALIQALNDLHIHEVTYARDRYQGEGRENVPSRMRIERTHWSDLPQFTFTPPALRESLRGAPAALWLPLWWLAVAVGAVGLAARGIRRRPR